MAPPPLAANTNGNLSAPGRRTAIDLTTNDDYVIFNALNQSADQSGPAVGTNPQPQQRPANHYGSTFHVQKRHDQVRKSAGHPSQQ